jgi:hypothetical protein
MYYNYNAIFGQGVTNISSTVLHPGYLCMKLPSSKGVIAIYGDQDSERGQKTQPPLAREMCTISKKEKEKKKEPSLVQQARAKLVEETKRVPLFKGNPDKQLIISSLLDNETENNLVKFLHEKSDIFSWTAKDLHQVDRTIIEHNLNVNKKCTPVKQKLCKMLEERRQATKAKVQCLLDAGVIRPVKYPTGCPMLFL